MLSEMVAGSVNSASDSGTVAQPGESEELFQIIDESGEGFGFDLTPEVLARPLAIGTASLFGIGMLAGIPLGLAMGRSEDTGKGIKGGTRVKPSMEGVKFAATTFGLGTLLCASMGAVGFYTIKSYYQVESFEEFGRVMRKAVPERRSEMESSLSPVLDTVRKSAGDNLPVPMHRLRERFSNSRFGNWIKRQVASSVTIIEDGSQQVELSNPDVTNHRSS